MSRTFLCRNGCIKCFLFYNLVAITRTWNGTHVHHRPVQIIFAKASGGLNITVNAPFFNDPKNPGGQPGQPFDGLWEYEGNYSTTFISFTIK